MRVSRPLDHFAWVRKKPEEAAVSETQYYKSAMCKHSRRTSLACPCGPEYSLVNVIIMLAGAAMIGAPFACWLMGVGV